jgi:hypothetical protein
MGKNGAGEAVVLNKERQNISVMPGIGVQERIQKWTEDGKALLTTASTPWQAEMYRVDIATGKRTLLQKKGQIF